MADDTLSASRAAEPAAPSSGAPAAHRQPFKIYKPGQGTMVRWGTAGGGAIITLAGVRFAYEMLRLPFGDNLVIRTLIPVALLVAAAYVIFWLVGKNHGTVDFFIATEGEMKKVNWSSRREVLGATKVVIFTLLALSILLFVVDLFFMMIFSGIGVLRIPIWESMFGAAVGTEL